MSLHKKLLELIVIKVSSDFEPFGSRSRQENWGPDCSCSCKFFLKLEGDLGSDWGVCSNHQSPRKGLLTHEHQGCPFFEETNQFAD